MVAVLMLLVGGACAGEAPCPRPLCEVWLISSRQAAACGDWERGARALRYWRGDEQGAWQTSTLEAFLEYDDPNTVTLFYLHGNHVEAHEATSIGWTWYDRLVRSTDCPHRVRFVIWSWPSQRELKRIIPDVRLKADWAEAHGFYVAWVIGQMPADLPVSLVGYSYGARMIASSLHFVGGGQRFGQRLAEVRERRPMRVVLAAAAVDADGFRPGGVYSHALAPVGRMLLITNPCDRVLKFYPRLRRPVPALGTHGISRWSAEASEKIELYDASGHVGKQHDWRLFIGSPHLSGLMRSFLLADAPDRPQSSLPGE